MATTTIKGKFLPQYRTATQWSAADPVLLRGEIGVESDTRKFKFGNGVNHWTDLKYANEAYPADINMTDWVEMLNSAFSQVSADDSVLVALQKIHLLAGNGEGAIFQARDTSNSYVGIAFEYMNGTTQAIRGIFMDTITATIGYFANGSGVGTTNLQSFIRLSDVDKISFMKSNGYKSAYIDSNLNVPGFSELPINSRLKFVDNKSSIRGVLQMLTASVCQGRLRIVVGNPSTGASGKPEIAFIVNNVQGTNAEIQGTNGLQIFHLTSNFIRVIQSSDIAMAWPTLQTLSDEDIIKKLSSTASGDWGSLGAKLPWTGGGEGTTFPEVDYNNLGTPLSGDKLASVIASGAILLTGDFGTGKNSTIIAPKLAAQAPNESCFIGFINMTGMVIGLKYVVNNTTGAQSTELLSFVSNSDSGGQGSGLKLLLPGKYPIDPSSMPEYVLEGVQPGDMLMVAVEYEESDSSGTQLYEKVMRYVDVVSSPGSSALYLNGKEGLQNALIMQTAEETSSSVRVVFASTPDAASHFMIHAIYKLPKA